MNLVEFIDKNNIDVIMKELPTMINKMSEYCDKVMGRGYFGEVTKREIGSHVNVTVNDSTINMPVVIKKMQSQHVGAFNMQIINDILYIYSDKDITCEAIILYYVSKLWYKGTNPHLPFMIGFGKCSNLNNILIDQIILEKYGLSKPLTFPIKSIEMPIGVFSDMIVPEDTIKNDLTTLNNLFTYITKWYRM
jgi:hypothetical protein